MSSLPAEGEASQTRMELWISHVNQIHREVAIIYFTRQGRQTVLGTNCVHDGQRETELKANLLNQEDLGTLRSPPS